MLVLQSDPFNRSSIATVIVAAITSNMALAEAPGNVRVGKADSGLTRPSVINVSQIITLDRQLLTQRVHPLPAQVMHKVDEGVRLVLGIH